MIRRRMRIPRSPMSAKRQSFVRTIARQPPKIEIRPVEKPAPPVQVTVESEAFVLSEEAKKLKLLIKWPTRGRPSVFFKVLDRYVSLLSGSIDVRFLVTCDEDDSSMNRPEIVEKLSKVPNVVFRFGRSKSKIQAVNADMDLAGDFDVLLLASDDMVPEVQGYDAIICENMRTHFPDLNGALWYNEGRAGSKLNTLSILGRKLYEHFGYIYHPDYYSMWCDNEFTDETVRMKACVYIDKVLIRHLWTSVTGVDLLHGRNTTGAVFAKDRQIYIKRKAAGFPKESVL